MMESFGPEYQQVLTLSMPAIEYVASPDKSPYHLNAERMLRLK